MTEPTDQWHADELFPGVNVLLRLMAMAPHEEIEEIRRYTEGVKNSAEARRLWALALIKEANKL